MAAVGRDETALASGTETDVSLGSCSPSAIELLETALFVLRNDEGLELTSIPAYTLEGEQVLVHGYELAQMTDDERWDWVHQWPEVWPDGRSTLLAHLSRLNEFAKQECAV
jgi:hypothetical protein